jgi:hypothetical protein
LKVYIVNRHDSTGVHPVKVFALKDNAKFFCGECIVALKLINSSDSPRDEFLLLSQFDSEAKWCNNISYAVEEISAE